MKIKALLLALICAFVCVATACAEPVLNEDNARARVSELNKFRDDDSVGQVLLVTIKEGSNGTAYFYEKNREQDNTWHLVFSEDVYVGKNSGGKTAEGDAKTPYGEFRVTSAFGICPNPGTALNYIDVEPTTYACDEDCEYYNQIIDTAETGHECTGEEMYACTPEYNYGMTVDYNAENVYPNGSAIFIHCKGAKPWTGGCIAFDEEDMITLLQKAEDGMVVYIDAYYTEAE